MNTEYGGRQPRLCGYTVMVVEDDYLTACDIADALQREGATALGPLSTVCGALRVVDSSAVIGGAVLDLNIRGEMVWPVADRLLGRNLPVVFATGYGAAFLPKRYGRVPCFDKPLLMAMVVQGLERPSAWPAHADGPCCIASIRKSRPTLV